MSNWGRFQNLNFLHIFVALLLKIHFPKGIMLKSFQQEIRAILTEILGHKNLFNAEVYGSNEAQMHNLKMQY